MRGLRRWSSNPVADLLAPLDAASAQLLHSLEQIASQNMQYGDWNNPVGGGVRKLRRISSPAVLSHLQAQLDSSEHSVRTKLHAAFELHYDHAGFDQASEELGNLHQLWHGVNKDRAAAVIATGLKTPKAVGSTTGTMFGPGIYFADDAGKSAQYIGVGGFGRNRGSGILLQCDVALGKTYEAKKSMPEGLDDPSLDAGGDSERYAQTNWDSVYSAVAYLGTLKQYLDPSEVLTVELPAEAVGPDVLSEAVAEASKWFPRTPEGQRAAQLWQDYAATQPDVRWLPQIDPDERSLTMYFNLLSGFEDWARRQGVGYEDIGHTAEQDDALRIEFQ